jgi:hypothetical protein
LSSRAISALWNWTSLWLLERLKALRDELTSAPRASLLFLSNESL